MKFAYADPPYPGTALRHYKNDPSGIPAEEVDYEELIKDMMNKYEAWALSMGGIDLRNILPFCPMKIRIGIYCRSFTPFRPYLRIAYAWEPVIFYGSRTSKKYKGELTVRDWIVDMPPIFQKKQIDKTKGQKTIRFSLWLFQMLGVDKNDLFYDLYPGSGIVSKAWKLYCSQGQLFDEALAPEKEGE